MLAVSVARLILAWFSIWDMLWVALCVLDVSLTLVSALFLFETWLHPESGSRGVSRAVYCVCCQCSFVWWVVSIVCRGGTSATPCLDPDTPTLEG
jgi:hypothetical protein